MGVLAVAVAACSTAPLRDTANQISAAQFEQLLVTLATGWNTNDAALAASVFADDAIYVEPPNKQLYVGKAAIYEFFGGAAGRDSSMNMQWHNMAFSPQTGAGAGEFTFSWPTGQVHGMVSIAVSKGKIVLWREYFYPSELDWEAFSDIARARSLSN